MLQFIVPAAIIIAGIVVHKIYKKYRPKPYDPDEETYFGQPLKKNGNGK